MLSVYHTTDTMAAKMIIVFYHHRFFPTQIGGKITVSRSARKLLGVLTDFYRRGSRSDIFPGSSSEVLTTYSNRRRVFMFKTVYHCLCTFFDGVYLRRESTTLVPRDNIIIDTLEHCAIVVDLILRRRAYYYCYNTE